ncbi:ABC transporter ATP-binding protein [Paenibacillus sp. YN15]|uniref:ABC transporter ATP-binding protein n=1 Tax=Paenibacillus sp. YN15 TaxID=1742774 RepID=UPI000DCCD6A7|nr:ABC transporter ATP-binding protein [Paenibacillus sp. YN15]RAV05434.1 ABC transporter ATP-binding protein [Paenibacillus sp. YN15]
MMKKQGGVFPNNLFILKLVFRICPGRIAAEFLIKAIGYAAWVFYSIVLVKYVLHAMETGQDFGQIACFILASALIFGACNWFEQWVQTSYKPKTDALLFEKLNVQLYDKAAQVELACYEDADFYNRYTMAVKETETRVSSVLETTADTICAVLAGIGVMANMYMIDHWVVLFVLSPFAGKFLFGRWHNRLLYARDQESVSHRRKLDYVNRVVYLQDYAKEIRMSGIFRVLKKTYEEGYSGIGAVVRRFAPQVARVHFWQNIFTFLVIFQGVLLYSLYRTLVSRTLEVSEFAVLTSAMVSASWILIGLSESLIQVFQNSLYIENLRGFLAYEIRMKDDPQGAAPEKPVHSLELKHVSFTYPGASSPVLRDISLRIEGTEKIALVGHNGAGKTTLVKLLMRLYDPSQGEVLLNGKDIQEYRLGSYRALFGSAFQDFRIFAMTVAENVLMRRPVTAADYHRVRDALIKSGVYEKVASLPKGMDTVLTREFDEDGAVLSGGEYQKIAVARAFAKEFDIAVFDEPSSALDPVAEYLIYQSMLAACRGKPVFFISHRLSMATLADRIYMLENGAVIETGTHDQLMALNGKYADMFRKQAEKYAEEQSEVGA